MKNQKNQQQWARQSWLDCIGDLNEKINPCMQGENPYEDYLALFSSPHFELKSSHPTSQCTTDIQINQADNSEFPKSKRKRQDAHSEDEHSFDKLQSEQSQGKECEQDSKESQKNSKKDCNPKQSLYSKSYRQRKKQRVKILQEENNFLKNKINQLQFRLRQKQLQINRLKYPPMEKDLTVEQLNEQFLNKTNLLLSKTAVDPQNYSKTVYTPADMLYLQFMKSYDEHGFGGSRKKNILNYYFNQMLEAVIRDSEKYLFLMCNQSKSYETMKGLETYEHIDAMFVEVMELDEEKITRMKHFSKNLYPFMIQLKNICAEFYLSYKKVITILDKVHNFMKESYLTNMDFARKRIQFENWVDTQKHTKLMRRLRTDWLQFIKQSAQKDSTQKKKSTKGNKKKKLQSDSQIN